MKKLGMVTVYMDEQDTETSSRAIPLGNNNFAIVLTPKVDKDQMEMRGLPYNKNKVTATTLAHEFGHVIGAILGLSAHSGKVGSLSSEVEAWKLANIEYPSLDKNQERAALAADKEYYGQ